MLLIRACKSENSKKRLKSIYRRFYCGEDKEFHSGMICILLSIVEKYDFKMDMRTMLENLNPNHFMYRIMKVEYDYPDIVLNQFISCIRLTERKKLLQYGFVIPVSFRRNS